MTDTITLSVEAWRGSLSCFCYTVYWKDDFNVDLPTWKYKPFYNIKEAKGFAKKMWKQCTKVKLKPYILETIVPCNFFKKEVFRKLNIADRDKYKYNYIKRVW